jgi:hypothetical protein
MRTFPNRVENYTNTFLAMAGLILFMALFTLAATMGFVWVLLSAAGINASLRFAATRAARSS